MKTVILPSLKTQRESQGWTQEVLADLAGVAIKTVQRAEGNGSVSVHSAMAITQAMGFTDYQQFMLSISKNEDLAISADSLNHANLHQTKSVSTLTELANTPNSDASLQKTKTDDELDAEAFKFVVSKMLTFACFIFWTFCIVKTVELSPFLGLCMIASVFIFVVAGGKRVKQALINTSKAVAFVGIPVVLFIQVPILPASDTLKDAKKLAMEIHDRSLYHSMRLATEPPIPIRSYFDLESKKDQRMQKQWDQFVEIYSANASHWPQHCNVVDVNTPLLDKDIHALSNDIFAFIQDCDWDDE